MAIRHRCWAAVYDLVNTPAERGWMGERRAQLLAAATGTVLEVGGGTGANLPHYDGQVQRVILTEPDPFMRARLDPKLAAARVPVEVVDARAEALPLPDGSIDTAVSTLVLCTVGDLEAALAEMKRVLRAGGRLLFIEHVRGQGAAARWQDRLEPVWRRVVAGCHPNRSTVEAIEATGFEIAALERFRPPLPQAALLPMVQGLARLPATL